MFNAATIAQPCNTLGLVASGKRSVRSGSEYAQYFDLSGVQGNEIVLIERGTVYDTVGRMKKIVNDTLSQTKRIAQRLKGSTREATARNVWEFLYHNVQYTKDHPEREQLRTPVRTWRDRKQGVDCDCYSIFISSVLTNLGVPHAFRIAKYKGDYQHVYVIVPKTGNNYSSYYTIDPVVDRFNYEVPPSQSKDYPMKTTMLNGPGFGACETQGTKPIIYVRPDQLAQNNLVSTSDVLNKTSLPHQTIVDENNNPSVVVTTPQGNTVKLPTVITAEQATQLKALAEQPVTQIDNSNASLQPAQASLLPISEGDGLAVGLGIASILYWAFSSNTPGMSGPPKNVTRKKMKSLNI